MVDTVPQIAGERGTAPAQVAMAWIRHRAATSVTALVPVIGPRGMAQLEGYLAALDVTLDEDQVERLDKVSRIDLGQPHTGTGGRAQTLLGDTGIDFRTPVVPVA